MFWTLSHTGSTAHTAPGLLISRHGQDHFQLFGVPGGVIGIHSRKNLWNIQLHGTAPAFSTSGAGNPWHRTGKRFCLFTGMGSSGRFAVFIDHKILSPFPDATVCIRLKYPAKALESQEQNRIISVIIVSKGRYFAENYQLFSVFSAIAW